MDYKESCREADGELFRKIDLLVEKYTKFENEYGIKRIIHEIGSNKMQIHGLLQEKINSSTIVTVEEYKEIKDKCKYQLAHYVDMFNSKFYDVYLTDNLFYIDENLVKSKYDRTINKLKYIKNEMKNISKYGNCYPLRGLATEDSLKISTDIQALDNHFQSIQRKLQNPSKESFIDFISDHDLVKDWFNFVEKCYDYVLKHSELLNRIRKTSKEYTYDSGGDGVNSYVETDLANFNIGFTTQQMLSEQKTYKFTASEEPEKVDGNTDVEKPKKPKKVEIESSISNLNNGQEREM